MRLAAQLQKPGETLIDLCRYHRYSCPLIYNFLFQPNPFSSRKMPSGLQGDTTSLHMLQMTCQPCVKLWSFLVFMNLPKWKIGWTLLNESRSDKFRTATSFDPERFETGPKRYKPRPNWSFSSCSICDHPTPSAKLRKQIQKCVIIQFTTKTCCIADSCVLPERSLQEHMQSQSLFVDDIPVQLYQSIVVHPYVSDSWLTHWSRDFKPQV